MDWIKDIEPEELPEQYQEMYAAIFDSTPEALRVVLRLAEHFGKMGFYFTSLNGLISTKKEEYIFNNFTGNNHQELARATGYSERWVYEILKKKKDDRQTNMF